MNGAEELRMCQECGEREATVHLTILVDGDPTQRHLCERCYEKQDGVPPLSPTKILSQLIGAIAPELQLLSVKQCPRCGINYLEFRQTLNLGCPNDYEVFAPALDEILGRMHAGNRHMGKVPRGAAQRIALGPRLKVLRRQLEQAVRVEDYEGAAGLRDQIRELEQDSAGSPEQ